MPTAISHSYHLDEAEDHSHDDHDHDHGMNCDCTDCQAPTSANSQDGVEIVEQNYSFIGPKWGSNSTYGTQGGVVTWSLASLNFGDEIAGITFDGFMSSGGAAATAIRAAFDAWEAVANIDFVEVPDATNVDIRLGWDSIDGASNVLATTWMYVPTFDETVIIFDNAENWDFVGAPAAGTISFFAVALHEIGHAIGLDHENDVAAIMGAYYNSSNPILSLQADDIAGAQALYGAPTGDDSPAETPAEDPEVDIIAGGGGSDRLNGSFDDDVIFGGNGNDTIQGGFGADTLAGGAGKDKLYGSAGEDFLSGGGGVDRLIGGSGNDTLEGGAGADTLQGGNGFDIASYSQSVKVSLSDKNGNKGEAKGDTLKSIEGLSGSEFRDNLEGNKKANYLEGNGSHDRLFGDNGKDTLMGGDGADKLDGGKGRDWLYGEDGDDILDGGKGSDIITGGSGNDKMTGDRGADFFHFGEGSGADRITDFGHRKSGNDKIVLDFDGIDQFSDLNGLIWQSGKNAFIDLGNGDSITLVGVDVDDLNASDFWFA